MMRTARRFGTLAVVLGLAAACSDQGVVAPLDEDLTLDQEAQLALSVLDDELATEAALANEAEVPYAAVAMSTDYDCWKDDEEPVTWKEIMEVFNSNAEKVKQLLLTSILKIK